MLERLGKSGFKIALKKCKFFQKEVDFLRFIVSVYSIRIDPDKIKSIIEWPTLTIVRDI